MNKITLLLNYLWRVDIGSILIFQMKKLRLSEVIYLVQGAITSKL